MLNRFNFFNLPNLNVLIMKGKILLNRIFVLQIKIFFKYFAFFPFYLLPILSFLYKLSIHLSNLKTFNVCSWRKSRKRVSCIFVNIRKGCLLHGGKGHWTVDYSGTQSFILIISWLILIGSNLQCPNFSTKNFNLRESIWVCQRSVKP